jgi:acid phosphatase type 7
MRVRRSPLVGAALALVLPAAGLARPADAAFPGRNGEVAYHGRASADGLLYLRRADGARLRRVRVPGRPAEPAFSPRGRRIAFASNGGIWVMNADGTDVRRLTPASLRSRSPAWSPRGAAIVFSAGARGRRDLYRIALDGSRLRRLTSSATDEDAPAWSWRGRIAFVRSTRGRDGDIHTIRPSGTRPLRLTDGRRDDGSPTWSPRGRAIAFTRGTRKRRPQLFVMRASGARERRLTSVRHGVTAPAWSPNGREIAFGTGRPGRRALHRMRLRGRKVRRVTSGATDVRSVTWQPKAADHVIAAAGDVACDPSSPVFTGSRRHCRMRQTSDLLLRMDLSAVLVLGDVQYEDGLLSKYARSFHPTWGRVKSVIRPVPGNHEYLTEGGAGYFDYFNGPDRPDGPAGPRGLGYYSYDVGAWHMIALNSQCTHPPATANAPGCTAGSQQERWLRADLAANRRRCTLAYWHHPLVSSRLGIDESIRPLWQALYEAGVDVVLTGHDHRYERFAPLDAAGNRDPARGIRQFVVGTGGRNHQRARMVLPHSEVSDQRTFGVLRLRLRPSGYFWNFVPEAGGRFTDSGSNACH